MMGGQAHAREMNYVSHPGLPALEEPTALVFYRDGLPCRGQRSSLPREEAFQKGLCTSTWS